MLITIVIMVGRAITPTINRHLPDLENWTSDLLHVPVKIGHVYLSWAGYQPGLTFDEVKILDKTTLQPVVDIHRIKVIFALFHSLFSAQPQLDRLRVSGVHFTVHEQAAGEFNVGGLYGFSINDSLTGASLKTKEMLGWIFSQPKLSLHEIEVRYISAQQTEQVVIIDNLYLKNAGMTHASKGELVFQQPFPTRIKFKVDWDGDITDFAQTAGNAQINFAGISLAEWLKQFSWQNWGVKEGIGSADVSLRWAKNQLAIVDSQFHLYNLVLHSPKTAILQGIPRLSGHVIWRRSGADQVITGDHVLVNLTNHLWPAMTFSITLVPAKDNTMLPKAIEMSYLDLMDTKQWLLLSGILPTETATILASLSPKGELKNVKVNLPLDKAISWANIEFAAQLNNIIFNSWHNYPKISNLSGQLDWNGKQGSIDLNSENFSFDWDSFFEKPLQFDQVKGQFHLTADTLDSWSLTANHAQLSNEDLNISGSFILKNLSSLPDVFPNLDLAVNFSVANIEKINNYLPGRLFDADLAAWLKQAFHTGQMTAGKIEVQGNLKDFPFKDNNGGKFLVAGVVRDLEFSYAPLWPMLNKVNGQLVFSGDTMTADVESGLLYQVPISKIHAFLNNLSGKDPAILKVDGVISSDLKNGLYFLTHSPLQKKMGTALASTTLSGPMELTLGLVIPIAKLENLTVKGQLAIADAAMIIPQWDLSIENLKGLIHFTEDDISASDLQGKLFDENAKIVISMQSLEDHKFVRVDLQSQIKVALLQDWLKIPLSKIIQGSTGYQVEVDLPAAGTQNPAHVTLLSNLQGISINLPSPYGKEANTATNFKFELFAQESQPLKTKFYYDNALTAAITNDKVNGKFQPVSGEIHVGSGEADWQTTPGFIITGQMDTFDWNTWQSYFNSLQAEQSFSEKALGDGDWWRSIDVTVNKLTIWERSFNQIRVQITKANNAWQIGVTNPEMAGQVILPMSSGGVVDAKFSRLYFPADDSVAEKKWDPKTLPAISFVGNDVHYGEKKLGRVLLNLVPSSAGLIIKQLQVESGLLKFNAQGYWKFTKGQYQSHLVGDVSTAHLTQLLSAWEMGPTNLVGSTGNVHIDLTWPDAPYKPVLGDLTGEITMKLGEGRITDLGSSNDTKLGIGRMLSILNLQTLPRRLSGDFSDLVEKGYSFDSISGTFSLKEGSAYTEDLGLNGPVARIAILGRIGLRDKDYDLNMSVTPYVTSSIPVVATIAGGPVAGVAAWVVDKVVSGAVSKVTTYHYKVEGTWERPIWRQIHTSSES